MKTIYMLQNKTLQSPFINTKVDPNEPHSYMFKRKAAKCILTEDDLNYVNKEQIRGRWATTAEGLQSCD